MAERYAIYYAPSPGTKLFAFGRSWLGRDPVSGATVPRLTLAGLSEGELAAITVEPARYGFHATLKAPFRLAEGQTASALHDALADFAAERHAFVVPGLTLARIGSFLALVPSVPCRALDVLAADCVTAFDSYRAPPTLSELARRRAAKLTPAQDTNLRRWGYPYVMDEFRFHMSLTGTIPRDRAAALARSLAPAVSALSGPFVLDRISLFTQSHADAPFRVVADYAFGAGPPIARSTSTVEN